ncbi:MAG: 2-amino-4-ketopentanoate thiolase [Deltaproteobacteria bacterium]|nr:2-amino-4-ketopentanoate thiolase [Candidatus Zymogenaceae bacterium]
MEKRVKKGTLVEIEQVILTPKERAPQVPDDTKKVPLVMRARGTLVNDAVIGEEARIETVTGRVLTGILAEKNPAYDHGFGEPIPELVPIGREVRVILKGRSAKEAPGT